MILCVGGPAHGQYVPDYGDYFNYAIKPKLRVPSPWSAPVDLKPLQIERYKKERLRHAALRHNFIAYVLIDLEGSELSNAIEDLTHAD